jgi:hypothetical protein
MKIQSNTEHKTIKFGNRKEIVKSLTRVVIKWSQAGSRPFKVGCLVYEHDIRSLYLGSKFLKKSQCNEPIGCPSLCSWR